MNTNKLNQVISISSTGEINKKNMMKNDFIKPIRKICFILFLLNCVVYSYSQVSIKGPACVIPGVTYHYVIPAKWDTASTMQVCITGGKLQSGDDCTQAGKLFSSVFVTWNDGTSGTINVKSSSGDASLSVTKTKELNGGLVTSTEKEQVFVKGKSVTFHCSVATGGSCKPSYVYQWQKSTDGFSWTDVSGAAGKNLVFNESILGNTFFRRVVTEKNSNTIAYSDFAQLTVVFPKMPGDSLFNAPFPKQIGN